MHRVVKTLFSRGSKLFIAVFLTATITPQILSITPASADTGGYLWYNAACSNSGSTLGQTSGKGYWCTNYNWCVSNCPTGDSYCTSGHQFNGYYQLDNWAYHFRKCTSYAAWKI